jgi:hypothetical protein
MMMIRALTVLSLALALGACGELSLRKKAAAPPPSDLATEFAPPVAVTPLGAAGQTPQALDTTTAAEKTAALAAAPKGGERRLGRQVAALGSPADPGLWVQTSLVAAAVQGRVEAPNGTSLAVELRPGTGGALMSLAAYQALGLPLTDLPELTVFAP